MSVRKGMRFVIDDRGDKIGVLLSYKTYTQLIEKLRKIEELEEHFLGKIAKERYRTLKGKKLLIQEEMEKRVL